MSSRGAITSSFMPRKPKPRAKPRTGHSAVFMRRILPILERTRAAQRAMAAKQAPLVVLPDET